MLSGCVGGDNEEQTTTLPPNDVSIDGIVTQGEYDHMSVLSDGKFTMYWRFEENNIVIAMVAGTEGMISLGLDPGVGMKDSDMLIGWVDDGTFLYDCYSVDTTGPHPEDTEIGGTNDIIVYAGSEADGITTIELLRKLDTGDAYDKEIGTSGELQVIWAISNSDSFSTKHSSRGGVKIELSSSDVSGY